MDHTGKINVWVRRSVLDSDQAITAVLSHETFEIEALREIFQKNGGSLPAGTYRDLTRPEKLTIRTGKPSTMVMSSCGGCQTADNRMIPYIKEFIEMNLRGAFPTWELSAYVVKKLSKSGTQSDFDELPDWLREGIRKEIASYKASGIWLILQSNSEGEDYAPYAEDVLQRFDLSS